jgi:putative heme-binding domain-containing protein
VNRSLYFAIYQCIPVLLLACAGSAYAQAVNPLQSDPRAVLAGGTIFRAQCASCHGANAKGIETIDAPDLTLIWTRSGSTEESVFRTIRDGIAGSIMPPHGFPDAEVWMLVSYLRSVAVEGTTNRIAGNTERGAGLFNDNCSRCHRVDGTGGSLGPDLSNITRQRSLDALFASVRNPSASIARRYKPISFRIAENDRVQGTIKSEDAFSLQIMDSNQTLRGFTKTELTDLTRDGQSLMPAFEVNILSESELNDVLSYLQSNRDR